MSELDRRSFLKITGLTAGAAATVACKEPVEKVIPYLIQPEEVTPGIATYYQSTCRECPTACAITVKTREGRPIKVEGRGDAGLCVRGQSSLARTYDANRFRGPLRRVGSSFEPISWTEALELLESKLAASPGKAFFLGGLETGTLDGLIDRVLSAIGSSNRLRYEPYAQEALRSANERLFGRAEVPHFDLAKAEVVVSFGTDFLETWGDPVRNQRGFFEARHEGHGYHALIGPRLGLSGGNAELWLAPEPGTEVLVALSLAREVARRRGIASLSSALSAYDARSVSEQTGIAAEKIEALAQRIAASRAALALPPGVEVQGTNAGAFAAAVMLLNVASGALGETVVFGSGPNTTALGRFADLKELAGKLRGGDVKVLMVHRANPVYDAPQVGFADAMANAFVVSFSSANDETTALADLVLPDHTPYESWGDVEVTLGERQLQQPTIRPIFDTRAVGDVLLESARRMGRGDGLPASFFEALRESWGGADALDRALADGGSGRPAAGVGVTLDTAALAGMSFAPAQIQGSSDDLSLVVYPSLHFYDGRSARIAMLNEIPDPVLKTAWGSFAELHPETAERLGLEIGDVVSLETEAGQVEIPVFPHASVRRGVVALQVGQGHIPIQPDQPQPDYRGKSQRIGVSAFDLIPGRLDSASGALAWYATRANVRKTGARGAIARTQLTFDQENRGFAKSMTLAAFHEAGDAHGGHGSHDAHGGGGHAAHGPGGENPGKPDDVYGLKPLPLQGDAGHLVTSSYNPAADAHAESPYRWGLNVDLDACSGCNACIAACAQENSTPVVGPGNVRIGREMFWMRIERYVEETDDYVDVRHLPMMCQHCGAAPCENVCPVIATYHTHEGLNMMIPNRCIGTRFCSNNCPYKARRFNHWRYDQYYEEPENFGLSPDVTVRGKGVMEKCSMCIQRIHDGKSLARSEGREARDGDITPACAQTCPSEAITFGNLRDPESRVTELRDDKRAYRVLEHLYTRPGVSYQKAIRRSDGDHEA
jgi:molybdopterin-containing oxidoreductase family iron-sulfur binding subunit